MGGVTQTRTVRDSLVSNFQKSTQSQGHVAHCFSPEFYSRRGEKKSISRCILTLTGRIFPKKAAAETVNHNHADLYGICITLEQLQVNRFPKTTL